MQILFLVFAASVVVLLLASWAILRGVRRHGRRHGGGALDLHLHTREPQEPGADDLES